jgi:hypothetical protein
MAYAAGYKVGARILWSYVEDGEMNTTHHTSQYHNGELYGKTSTDTVGNSTAPTQCAATATFGP